MRKKRSNKEWENYINKYYSSNSSMTINEFCKENNLSKQQFHYHKKRISETKDSIPTVFHGLKISGEKETYKKATAQSEVKITIGNATVAIPVSETTLIASIIKELAI